MTGHWLTDHEAADPEYWGQQVRQPVMFSKGIESIHKIGCRTFLETGPGAALSRFVMSDFQDDEVVRSWSSLSNSATEDSSLEALHQALAGLWLRGAPIDWQKHHAGEARRRIGLPTYPFERERFWLDKERLARTGEIERKLAPPVSPTPNADIVNLEGHKDIGDIAGVFEQQVSVMRQQLECLMEIGQ